MTKHQRPAIEAASMVELSGIVGAERDGLLRGAAAFQLMPENASKWVRFERLLEVATGSPLEEPQLEVSRDRLRSLLTQPPIASDQIRSQEDPLKNLSSRLSPSMAVPIEW